MEGNSRIVNSRLNADVTCTAIAGHFATDHAHKNYFVDLTDVKVRQKMAYLAAAELARTYHTVQIDAIVCMEGMEMIGAFLASELARPDQNYANKNADVCIFAPEYNSNNQMIFRENIQTMVQDKNVLLLAATVSSGETIIRAVDCLTYYRSSLIGVSAIFSTMRKIHGVAIASIFDERDFPGFTSYIPGQCRMCEQKQKIDAIVNSFGLTRLD